MSADDSSASDRRLSVAFVLPYGEPDPGFFPDVLLELCCARARAAGHRASLVRVYYDGRDPGRDAEIRARLARWLEQRGADVVVVERLFDPEPVLAHVAAAPGRSAISLCFGGAEPAPGIELALGLANGVVAGGGTRRSAAAGDLVAAFERVLHALATGGDPFAVAGVARCCDAGPQLGAPLAPAPLPSPFEPALDHEVICLGPPPALRRKHLLGNAGCPFAADPADNPHYAGLSLPRDGSVSRLGCAFCPAGGDYQKRDDAEVVASLLEQARYYQTHVPDLDELVLIDQHPVRYLAQLLAGARDAGLRPLRWLFQTRADSFVRERDRVRAAIEAAVEGQVLEVYLIGFESFSDAELARFNKGVTSAELLEAVAEMRELSRRYPGRFEYAKAQGHSLVLWSPWTTLDDLRATVAAIREHDLGELFSELGRNRLRLYADLPIYRAAERDGALLDTWSPGDEGAGRRKGYSFERPWRFLDPRTRIAYVLATALRERLGNQTELEQLAAAVDCADREVPEADALALRDRVLSELAALDGELTRIARAPGRAATERAATVLLDRNDDAAAKRIDAARAAELPIALAGREPTRHPRLLDLIRRAAGDDRRAVAVISDGRRFSQGTLATEARAAGLTSAVVRLPPRSEEPAFAEAWEGLRALASCGVAVELRPVLHRDELEQLATLPARVREHGAARVRVEVALDELGLNRLAAARHALDQLANACRAASVSFDASSLTAGTKASDRVPRAG